MSDFEPCGRKRTLICDDREGHDGFHIDACGSQPEVWEERESDPPLVAGGQGRDAEEIADVRWVGVVLLVIVSGLVGALVLRAAQVVMS